MKKTFTKEEFKALTHEIVEKAQHHAEEQNMSDTTLLALLISYSMALSELTTKLFDQDTDTIEITTEENF